MTDEQFNLLMKRLDGIEKNIEDVKKNMLTKDEGVKVSETLEYIAVESAATAETKAEAGYAILSSLFKGLENRVMDRLDSQDNWLIDRFNNQDKQMEAITQTLSGIHDILNRMVEKDERQDQRIWQLERKVSGDK